MGKFQDLIKRKLLNEEASVVSKDELLEDLNSLMEMSTTVTEEILFDYLYYLVDSDILPESEYDYFYGLISELYSEEDEEMDYDDIEFPEDEEEYYSEEMSEATKIVVRNGKKVKKLICPPGFKSVNGKCKKMSAQELRTRAKAAILAARKRKGKMAQILKKRRKSLQIRKAL